MKQLYRTIKYGFQRMFRGYDDRIFWGFSGYFYDFTPAIRKFCNDNLGEEEFMKLNPEKKEVLETTIKLLNELDESVNDILKEGKAESKFWSYFGENIGYFWD